MQYGNNDDKTISVRNFDRTASPDGSPNVITGFAYVTDASQPGKLSLKFDNIPYVGSYWVLSLGPEEDGKYQWSIVTDKNGVFLFVLARDVTTFKTKYDATVKLQLNELGFKGLSAPLPVYQGSDCQYEHSIRKKQIEDNFCTECELRCSNSIY